MLLAGSSETVRGAPDPLASRTLEVGEIQDEETVRPPWRHGELGRNDPATLGFAFQRIQEE